MRTRLTVQQAHTHEWIGTFGNAGNGERWPRLRRGVEAIVAYLRARGVTPSDGLIRLDGEFGWARAALLFVEHALGYLMRCSDYRLLDSPEAQAALARRPERFVQTDTATERDVYEAGWAEWSSEVDNGARVMTRLIVTRTPAPKEGKPKVGKHVGDFVYELFVTDRSTDAFTACDVLSLYFGRGAFEQTLSEEDREIEPDRWVSGHPDGQEAWQVLAQWVWNLRLRLGLVAAPCSPRGTRWADELQPSKVPPPEAPSVAPASLVPPIHPTTASVPLESASATSPSAPVDTASLEPVPLESASATSPSAPFDTTSLEPEPLALGVASTMRAPGPFDSGFARHADGTLRCPENKVLRVVEIRHARKRARFAANSADCRACARSAECRRSDASGAWGRRIDWPLEDRDLEPAARMWAPSSVIAVTPPSPPAPQPARPLAAPPGPKAVDWYDLPATTLRRTLTSVLAQQHVDGLQEPAVAPPVISAPLQNRDQRAHRRLRWNERWARNARRRDAPAVRLDLHGVPARLATYLGMAAAG